MSNGFVFYRGPSMIDGSPIVAIATGIEGRASRNAKTGGIVQTWILREDMSPVEAVKSGADRAICGDCPHRGAVENGRNVGRSCYVTVFQAPLVVFKSMARGLYPNVSPTEAGARVSGRKVRLGSYGDPAAVPLEVWAALLASTEAHTGYTHQWRAFPAFKAFTMASCDTPQDQADAVAQGWRTFRGRLASEPVLPREVICPASKEAGEKTNCALCRACGGAAAKAKANIVIIVHGAANKVNAYAGLRAA